MFTSDEKNFMKPLASYDWFLSDALRCGLKLNPDAFSREQFWSKLWCVQMLKRHLGTKFHTIYILGGWYGTLAAMLLQDNELKIKKIVNLDLDNAALEQSKILIQDPRYEARKGDLNEFLAHSHQLTKNDLVICSICEHLSGLKEFNLLKPSVPIIFQSTNLKCDDHINTKESLEEFQIDLQSIQNFHQEWAGMLDLKWFKRFMIMGQILKRRRFFNLF